MIRVKWHHFYVCQLDFVHSRVTAGIAVIDFPGSLVNLPYHPATKISAGPLKLPTILIRELVPVVRAGDARMFIRLYR